MTTLTNRLPDDTVDRRKTIAKVRDFNLNKLIFEVSANAVELSPLPVGVGSL